MIGATLLTVSVRVGTSGIIVIVSNGERQAYIVPLSVHVTVVTKAAALPNVHVPVPLGVVTYDHAYGMRVPLPGSVKLPLIGIAEPSFADPPVA
jgi:hypothetical protein